MGAFCIPVSRKICPAKAGRNLSCRNSRRDRITIETKGGHAMLQQNIILLALFALGIIFNNSLIAAGSGILLILRFVRLNSMLVLLEQRAMEAGLLLLLIAVFVPFAQDKVTLPEVA
ncbi:MAG TPA: hypothetical protein DD782_05340, partial [Firmicutes bacterium]|nr:hypothetical protein [Bacillota bacterium]